MRGSRHLQRIRPFANEYPILMLSLVVLGFVAVANGSDGALPSYIYGSWVVKRLLTTSNITAIVPSEEKAMIGTVAIYSASQVRVRFSSPQERFGLDNYVVDHPKYGLRRDSADEFFRETYLGLRDISIRGESVEIIEIRNADGSDVIAPGTMLYIRDKNHLVTTWDGGYFEMVRQR